MKNRRAVELLNPMGDTKNEGKNRGGKGTTPVTTACPEAGEKCAKKKKKSKGYGLCVLFSLNTQCEQLYY